MLGEEGFSEAGKGENLSHNIGENLVLHCHFFLHLRRKSACFAVEDGFGMFFRGMICLMTIKTDQSPEILGRKVLPWHILGLRMSLSNCEKLRRDLRMRIRSYLRFWPKCEGSTLWNANF
jgi:hypothetical protein